MINWKVVLCLCLGSLLMFGPPSICWSEPLPQNTGDITQKIENVFKKKTPQGPAAPFQAVTTSLKDAYPIANWLDSYSQVLKPQPTSSLTLAPGYYRVTVRSYCLHAGAYAPTQGAGYLLSPLKGTQAPLITSILEKSEAHPEVAQQDVQQLIWGIEAGVKYSQYPPAFRARVAPLLSPQDITSMEEVQMLGSWLNSLTEHLPKDAQEITNYFTQLREMLVNPSMSYSQIEQYAVKTGVPPLGAGSKNYPEGQWAYARDGFYVREVGHNGYWSTTLEILRPAPFSIERDTQGRIAKLHSGNSTMELSYENQPGGQPVSVEGFPAIRTWRVASIKMLGLTSHEPTVIPASSTATMTPTSLANDWTGALQRLAEYGRVIGHPVNFQSPDSQDLADLTTLLNGLASSRPVLQASASAATLSAANESVLNAWAYAACAQLGHCVSGAQTSSAAPERLDLAGFVESPANTSMQRLGQGGTGNAPAELAVTGFWLTVPLDSVTILLTKSASTSPPYHGITSNSTQKCTTLTFNNQDTGGNDASANASFTINVTVLNQSTRNLAPPTLQAVPNPATDVAGRRPTWVANLVPPVTEIAPGQTTTLTYQVTASWASFTQPDQLTQSLEHIGTDNAGYAVDALKDLKVISSDTAGLISNVAEVAPALVDTLNLLQTHFILSVNYQLALAGQGYSVSYSQLPAANMAVAVYAPPQEVGAFSVFFPMKLSQLGVADTVPVPVLSQLLAQWVDTNATCQSQGQNSNACVMASAHWNDDAWYDQVLTGGDVVCQFNGTSTFSSCSQQFGCQSIGPGNSGNLARQESPSAATALPAPADRSQNTSAMKRTNVTVLASPGRVAPSGTCTISGVARGANGQLLADATVQLTISLDGTSIPTISVTTDSNGSYSTTFNAPPVAGRVSIMATLVGTSPPATAKTALTVATERP